MALIEAILTSCWSDLLGRVRLPGKSYVTLIPSVLEISAICCWNSCSNHCEKALSGKKFAVD